MTDDFSLFDDPQDDGGSIDPDTALISAYLAHELSPVQIAAVDRRRTTDLAFESTFRSISSAWSIPIPRWDLEEAASDAVLVAPPSANELDAGWRRLLKSTPAESETGRARRSMTRVAAVIALIVLPSVTFGQLVVYAARHPGVPGHALALALIPTAWRDRIVPSMQGQPHGPVLAHDSPVPVPFQQLSAQHTAPASPDSLMAASSAQWPVRNADQVVRKIDMRTAVATVRVLSNGSLIIADGSARSVVITDTTFRSVRTIFADAADGAADLRAPLALLQGLGDTTLVLSGGQTLVVVSPTGEKVRSVPFPLPTTLTLGTLLELREQRYGVPGAVRGLGFVYRAEMIPVPPPPPGPAGPTTIELPNPSYLLRMNLDTRAVDTLARIDRDYRLRFSWGNGSWSSVVSVDPPIPANDAWTVLPDGRVAVLTQGDYTLGTFGPGLGRFDFNIIDYPQRRMTSQDRAGIVDSVNARARSAAAGVPRTITGSDVPDFWPPIGGPAPSRVLSDSRGNLWVRSQNPSVGPHVYAVMTLSGQVKEHVRIPPDRELIGVLPDGRVLLRATSGARYWIELAALR